jgi:hypothetical protein
MKFFTLLAFAGVVVLGGCASTNLDGASAKAEESYTPIGTLIARKSPNRAERPTQMDTQALENDRTMGGANTDGAHR